MTSFSEMRLGEFLTAVGAKSPAPGGGAVASAVGALSAALAQMVVNYSIGKKNLLEQQGELQAAIEALEKARAHLLELAQQDAAAYAVLNELQRLPPEDARRTREIGAAVERAVEVPWTVLLRSIELLKDFERLAPMTNKFLRSDLGIAAVLAEATARSAAWNVRINAGDLSPARKSEVLAKCDALVQEAKRRCEHVELATKI
ncbi:MAG TPA: cyclodeaminase/cyclohydrolase family protein [Phycisphaerales bacterium]